MLEKLFFKKNNSGRTVALFSLSQGQLSVSPHFTKVWWAQRSRFPRQTNTVIQAKGCSRLPLHLISLVCSLVPSCWIANTASCTQLHPCREESSNCFLFSGVNELWQQEEELRLAYCTANRYIKAIHFIRDNTVPSYQPIFYPPLEEKAFIFHLFLVRVHENGRPAASFGSLGIVKLIEQSTTGVFILDWLKLNINLQIPSYPLWTYWCYMVNYIVQACRRTGQLYRSQGSLGNIS